MLSSSTCVDVFAACVEAIRGGKLIGRTSSRDKEFHFQEWFGDRLVETGLNFEVGARNTYPDFRLVASPEGFEVKGLAYPGRETNYDCNSQVPSGSHNGRTIYYVFGRYPAEPDGDEYPVLDLVICHGDFLNADHTYVHENKHILGFGSYGDILIRDRKMYVAPTPFGLTEGAAHQRTLILPSTQRAPARLRQVGSLIRREADQAVVAYRFDLRTNALTPEMVANHAAGTEHHFSAFRLRGDPAAAVAMRALRPPTDGRCEDE